MEAEAPEKCRGFISERIENGVVGKGVELPRYNYIEISSELR